MKPACVAIALTIGGLAGTASAFQPPPPAYGYPPPPYPAQSYFAPPAGPPARSSGEIATLYGVSAAYGVGLGIWLDAEIGIEDPGLLLIPPAILGVAAPVGVYFLDQPKLRRGHAAAIAAGMTIGAAEGLGIAGTQFVIAKKEDAWGFRGLARSVALGATVGGAAGYLVGYYQEPSPRLSAFVSSGAFWGTAIGASIGYGVSKEGIGYGESNDSGAIGGLIGLNVGLLATAGVSTLFVPTWHQIGWTWAGAGIGAAASLPVFLFYAGDDAPPAKRGLIFTGTAMALGGAAAFVLSSGSVGGSARGDDGFPFITHVTPMAIPGGAGVSAGGVLP